MYVILEKMVARRASSPRSSFLKSRCIIDGPFVFNLSSYRPNIILSLEHSLQQQQGQLQQQPQLLLQHQLRRPNEQVRLLLPALLRLQRRLLLPLSSLENEVAQPQVRREVVLLSKVCTTTAKGSTLERSQVDIGTYQY